jgi:tRNA A37 threonylcarbamoyladenosine synthetase subunit TsaC/SUA5/YrdC
MATTSANLSGEKPARSAEQIVKAFGDKVDLILDVGPLAERQVSTVVSAVSKPFKILREGGVSRKELASILGNDI